MNAVQVIGRFIDVDRMPIEGEIEFIPQRVWVEDKGETYVAAHHKERLMNGRFLAYLTRTDTEELPWFYKVVSPLGTWHIEITEDGPLKLADLIPAHRHNQ